MPVRPAAVIGLDIGTSAVKGLLAGPGLTPLASAVGRYGIDIGPGGRVEADTEAVLAGCRDVIAALAAAAARRGVVVRGMCAGGSGDEAAWVDNTGRLVAPVPTSLDSRADGDAAALVRAIGAPQWISTTGLPVSGAYPVVRLRWLRRTSPDAAARVHRLLAWPELLAFALGVDPRAEPTLAARSGAWSLDAHAYDEELLGAAGLPSSVLPRLVPTGSVLGRIPRRRAAALGLPANVALVAGGFDQAMATLGSAVLTPRVAHVGAGSWQALTVLAAARPTADLVLSGSSVGPSIAAAGAWSVMSSGIGGAASAWVGGLGGAGVRGRTRQDPGRRAVALAARAPDAPSGLIVLPDLDGSAAPAPDRGARAVIAGLSLGDGPSLIALAVQEGVAMDLAARLDHLATAGMSVDEVRVSGGGSRGRRWLQLRADVAGRAVRGVHPADAGAAGAAALAAVAIGLAPDVSGALATLVRLGRPVAPRPDRHEAYLQARSVTAGLRSAIAAALRDDGRPA